MVTHGTAAVLWMTATPVVVWLARRIPIVRRGVAGRLAIHLALAATVALLHVAAWRGCLTRLLEPDTIPSWPNDYVTTLFVNVLTYFILFGVAHYERATRRLRERENLEATVRAALDEARLREATLRAQPEELCRTLEEIAEGVARDVSATERALVTLAERLRRTLDERRETTITRGEADARC